MERNVLIDTTPDLRQQALRAKMTRLDAVLYTHDHADHIMGLDDIRPFNYGRADRIPVYAPSGTLQRLQRIFPYGFAGESTHAGGVPRLTGRVAGDAPIELFGMRFQPFAVHHGPKMILGYRFGRAAYVTDPDGFPCGVAALPSGPRRAVPRSATPPAPSDALDSRGGARLGRAPAPHARILHPHLARLVPQRDEPRPPQRGIACLRRPSHCGGGMNPAWTTTGRGWRRFRRVLAPL